MERTFVMLKPGVLHRRIMGEILNRFERKGFKIIALKMIRMDKKIAETHYAEHKGKKFYQELVDYTCSGPIVAMILEDKDAVSKVRRMIGSTNVNDSLPGTIRGDFASSTTLNIVHASDSNASADREIPLFFKPEEMCLWEDGNQAWF
ncbi:MAG: nucleoside-diphosphate kinase [Spirochaetaceae bacterium]|jgi:nucleoside-diphosphate kinase|nr:nucleoside-diphosphate kinase [Spirochaetaceae bacterium]